jgi:hypothetical protein
MSDAPGTPLHTRSLTIAISRDSDTLWRARGDVIDLRKKSFVPLAGDIQPSGVIHMMSIELTFDPIALRIESIVVEQPFIAIEATAATGGECCRDPAPRLLALTGETFDAGFTKRLASRFAGPLGCSHLLTLFQLMASTIPRAVALESERSKREASSSALGVPFFRRSLFVDGLERSEGSTIDVVLQLADTQTRPTETGARATERLELSHEIKAEVAIDRKRFQVEALEAMERKRRHDSLGALAWTLHNERLGSLVGTPLIPGMAGRVFGLLGDDPEARPLLDLLLQLAPGFIQIIATLMDDYFQQREQSSSDATISTPLERPSVAALGGNTNSCYMWRQDGHLEKSRGA